MPELWRESLDSEVKPSTPQVIAALAAGQHGVVTRRQLLDAGVARAAIERRLTSGLLVPLHRGVYAVGHGHIRREGRWLAATLAIPHGVLSHRDAAGLHGIRPANHRKIDVTTTRRSNDHDGIEVHRTRVLDARDVTTTTGIRTTTLARTLVDLAGAVPQDHLAKALRAAEDQRTLDVAEVQATMARTKGRPGPGHRALKDALAELEALATTLTRSSLEDAFLRLVDRAGLSRPQTNVLVNGYEVDAVWRATGLVVELDGWAHHRSHHAFQRDRARTAELMRAGYRVLRLTHYDVIHRPAWTTETLAALTAPRATMSSPWP